MGWEVTVFLLVLFILAMMFRVVRMALHNVKCLDELTRLNKHYKGEIKTIRVDNAILTSINTRLRSRQQELLEENLELRRKCESMGADLATVERKLKAANTIIEQNTAWSNKRETV